MPGATEFTSPAAEGTTRASGSLEDGRVSKLWAWSLATLTLGLGFSAGLLSMMFLFMQLASEPSRFIGDFPIADALQGASPGTEWRIIDDGSTVQDPIEASALRKRFIAECRITSAEQAWFQDAFEARLLRALNHYELTPVLEPSRWSRPGASAAQAGEAAPSWNFSATYRGDRRMGAIMVTTFREGDRLIVIVHVDEH